MKRHSDFFKSLMLLNDLLLVSLAWWAADLIRFHTFFLMQREDYLFHHYVVAWLIILGVGAAVFVGLELYRPRRISSRVREIVDLIKGSSLALLVFLAILFLIREIVLSWAVAAIFWLTSLVLLSLSHVSVCEALRFLRRRGYNLRSALIFAS